MKILVALLNTPISLEKVATSFSVLSDLIKFLSPRIFDVYHSSYAVVLVLVDVVVVVEVLVEVEVVLVLVLVVVVEVKSLPFCI